MFETDSLMSLLFLRHWSNPSLKWAQSECRAVISLDFEGWLRSALQSWWKGISNRLVCPVEASTRVQIPVGAPLILVFPPVFFLLSFFFGFLGWKRFMPQTIFWFFIPHCITTINRAIVVDWNEFGFLGFPFQLLSHWFHCGSEKQPATGFSNYFKNYHSINSRNLQCYPLPRPTSFLLPQFLVLNLMKCGLDVYDNNLSFENFLCYIQVPNTFLTLVLGVLMER